VSEIGLVFGIPPERPLPNVPPSWNVAPTDSLPVVRYSKAEQRSLDMLRWALIPYRAKDIKVGCANINAKAEGIENRPAFGKAFERRRCLVPVDGFYEWKKTETGTTALGIALVMTVVCVLSHRWLRLLTATRHAEPNPRWTATLTTFAGLLLGVFVTVSSVGAGAIGMTALVLLYPRTPIARLVGSDIAHAVPLTLIAGVGHWLLGSVDWVLLGSLIMGSLPGIFFGSHLSARVPDKVLRPVLATILVIVGERMLRA
jgi:hypothetical protein